MNANELADYLLDHMHDGEMTDLVMGEAATMLRQLQTENEALKAKTLTDEEIMECKAHVEVVYGCLAPLEFAWLILRKAQEK